MSPRAADAVSPDPSPHAVTAMIRSAAAALPAALLSASLLAPASLGAQQAHERPRPDYDVQIDEGAGTYPVGSLLIRNVDSVWTAAGEILEGADILIRDGIIDEIGTGLSAPGDVRVIDGRGMHAIPGLVDEHSHTAMAASNEGSAPLVPEVRVMDALDTEDFGIYRALSGGVTTARIMHGSANPVGGQSAVIKMRWGMDRSHDLLLPGAPKFVKFALGENVTDKGFAIPGRPQRFPGSRQGVEAIHRAAFTAAREYRDLHRRYEEDPGAFRVPPRRDLRLEALVDIMEGRIRVHAHSYRSDEILTLMRIAEEFGFRIDVFTHVLEGYRVADEMAAHGAAGSTFTDWWQYKLEAYDAIPYNAAIMWEHGVLTAINSDIPWLQSFMIHEIPKPVKYGGVPEEEALKMLTLNPARMMYVDDRVGSLEEGKQGDVVLLNGSPFDSYVRVEKTVVDGIVYYDLAEEERTRGEPFAPIADLEPGTVADPLAGPEAAADPAAMGSLPAGAGPAVSFAARGGTSPAAAATGLPSSQEPVLALVGGTVHPVSGPPVEDGVVVVQGGTIAAVGPRAAVTVPAGARTVDVSGRHVYPGMIDPVTTLGILEFGQVGQAADDEERGTYNPHVRAVAAVQPHGAAMKVARANGITAALVSQTEGIIQNTAGVVALSDGDTWEQVTVEDRAALVVDWPVTREPRDPDDEPGLDDDRLAELVEAFRRAREFAASPAVAGAPTDPTAATFWEPNEWAGDRVFLEAMVPAVTGEMPVLFRMDSDWQVRHLFLFLDEFPEVDAVVVGGQQAFRVADELARRDVAVILTGAYRPTPDRDDSITASYRNAELLRRAGVRIAFGTDSSADSRNLPYHAAHSVAFGLPVDEALKAVTLNTADILGLGDRMGSLEPGKRADLIVTDGDPLQVLTDVERMWVGGVEVDPDDNKHHRLYEAFRNR